MWQRERSFYLNTLKNKLHVYLHKCLWLQECLYHGFHAKIRGQHLVATPHFPSFLNNNLSLFLPSYKVYLICDLSQIFWSLLPISSLEYQDHTLVPACSFLWFQKEVELRPLCFYLLSHIFIPYVSEYDGHYKVITPNLYKKKWILTLESLRKHWKKLFPMLLVSPIKKTPRESEGGGWGCRVISGWRDSLCRQPRRC